MHWRMALKAAIRRIMTLAPNVLFATLFTVQFPAYAVDEASDNSLQAWTCSGIHEQISRTKYFGSPLVEFYEVNSFSKDGVAAKIARSSTGSEIKLSLTPRGHLIESALSNELRRIAPSVNLPSFDTDSSLVAASVDILNTDLFAQRDENAEIKSFNEEVRIRRENSFGPHGVQPYCLISIGHVTSEVPYKIQCGISLDPLWADRSKLSQSFMSVSSIKELDVKLLGDAKKIIYSLSLSWRKCK